VSALAVMGCGRERAKHLTAPRTLSIEDFKDARWVTDPDELSRMATGAAKSPLMARAVLDETSDVRLALHPNGIIGAVGTAPDGSAVRMTLLPYQYSDDSDRAMYFALLESGGKTRVESFEMLRNRKPASSESGFLAVNGARHGLWMRSGPLYEETPRGIVRMAPERVQWGRFAACFIPMVDSMLGYMTSRCEEMGDFPHCHIIGVAVAIAMSAIYCAWTSWVK